MKMKKLKTLIFLDDERNFEDVTWKGYIGYDNIIIVRNFDQFKTAIMQVEDLKTIDLSLDHDIQDFSEDGEERTGYTCVKWLCDYVYDADLDLRETFVTVHSKNPIGQKNIEMYLVNFIEFMYT